MRMSKRERIMALLAEGYLTQAEAAGLMGVSRQRVHQWVTAADIHPLAARERHLRRLVQAVMPSSC